MMFFKCNEDLINPDCRFISIAMDPSTLKPGWSLLILEIMIFIEMGAFIVGFVVASASVYVFNQSSSVHANLARILVAFSANFYILVCSRIVLLLFECGYLNIKAECHFTLLLAASIAHIHYVSFSLCCFPGFIIERLFATIHITDYEKRQSTTISTTIITIVFLFSLYTAISSSFGIVFNVLYTVLLNTASVSAFLTFGVILSIFVYRKNKRYLVMDKTAITYSLSTKFQTTENFRVFRAMLNIAATCGTASLCGVASLLLHLYYTNKDANVSALFGQFFNLLHTISIPLNIVIFVFSQPSLRREYQLKLRKRLPCIPVPAVVDVIREEVDAARHFEELARSWNNNNLVVI